MFGVAAKAGNSNLNVVIFFLLPKQALRLWESARFQRDPRPALSSRSFGMTLMMGDVNVQLLCRRLS
jgi:hypothetical protein